MTIMHPAAVKAAEQHAGDEEVLWKSKCNFPFPKVPPIPHQYRDSISNVLQEKECTIEIYRAPVLITVLITDDNQSSSATRCCKEQSRDEFQLQNSTKMIQQWEIQAPTAHKVQTIDP